MSKYGIEPGTLHGRPLIETPVDPEKELLARVKDMSAKEMRRFLKDNPEAETAINRALANRKDKP